MIFDLYDVILVINNFMSFTDFNNLKLVNSTYNNYIKEELIKYTKTALILQSLARNR